MNNKIKVFSEIQSGSDIQSVTKMLEHAARMIVSHQNKQKFPYNLLKPNDISICRTAALTSRRYILNIYSTNIHTEYFKHAA